MSLDLKQLNAIEKSMLPVVEDDAEKTAEVKAAFAKFRKALKGGDAVSSEDIDSALMEVLVDEPVAKGADSAETQVPDDPMAPIFDTLFREVAPFVKGLKPGKLQELFHKAYGGALGEVETVINQTVEATATELGAIEKHDDYAVGRGKNRIPPKPGGPGKGMGGGGPYEDNDDDDGDDEDCDDMEKILKGAGLSRLAKRFGEMQAELAALTHDKAMGLFQKRAADAGVPGMASDLLAIHEVNPELAVRIEKQFKANHEALRKGRSWSAEIGSGRDTTAEGVAGPLSQLNGLAQEMIQKGLKGANGKTISFAKAFTLACDQNPELFVEYQRQKTREIARGGA